MKRSSTTCYTSKPDDESKTSSNTLKPNWNDVNKSFNSIQLSYSSNTLNEDNDDLKLIQNDDEILKDNLSSSSIKVVLNQTESPESKSKSMTSLNIQDLNSSSSSQVLNKLVSPYGDWCAFTGGSGSGGCIFTGPYEPMIISKDDFSDESFESTEESDANIDFIGPIGITHNNFQNTEVVWAKRPALPWFPGIIIDPNSINKEVKELMKQIGASSPHKDQLVDYSLAVINSRDTDKLFFIFLFNRKKTWLWLPESKLRPFCKENDKLFLENSPLLTSKYKKELEKAYKKAKKFAKSTGPLILSSKHLHHDKHEKNDF